MCWILRQDYWDPVMAAIIPAGLGALVLLIFPYAMTMISLGLKINGDPAGMVTNGWQTVIFNVMYWPLAAWSPLLALVTRRRRAAEAPTPASPRDLFAGFTEVDEHPTEKSSQRGHELAQSPHAGICRRPTCQR
jgi:hypothetical protein